ncbi:MAG: transferase hexapeptide repeat containing protein [Verrucomicrobia bacterium]|nr:transferase hexapeptide repeat containing protein [Verrucomicrobiota bacterium]
MMLVDFFRSVRGAVRARGLRRRGVELGSGAMIGAQVEGRCGAARNQRGRIQAGANLRCERGVILNAHGGSIALGEHVYLGPYTVVYGHGGVTIGDHCLIAMHCSILSSNHAVPAFGTPVRTQADVLLPTKIGRDVWLGAGVTVLGGVTIGDGCVVGAGAVVTKDLAPGSIAYGTPAVVRGWREGAPR